MSPSVLLNRPFLSSLVPLFQNESKCEAFHIKMSSDMKGQSVSQEWFHSVIFATGMFQENTNKTLA